MSECHIEIIEEEPDDVTGRTLYVAWCQPCRFIGNASDDISEATSEAEAHELERMVNA